MVAVIDENMILWTTVDDLPAATLDSILISQEYRKEVVHSHIFTSVVLQSTNTCQHTRIRSMNVMGLQLLLHGQNVIQYDKKWAREKARDKTHLRDALVDVTTLRVVDNSAWPRIFTVMRNVIKHKNNNVFIFQSSFLQNLVSMAHISLHTINMHSHRLRNPSIMQLVPQKP